MEYYIVIQVKKGLNAITLYDDNGEAVGTHWLDIWLTATNYKIVVNTRALKVIKYWNE